MSDGKSAHIAGSVNTGMTIGSGQHAERIHFQAKLLGVTLFIIIILAAGVWYVFWRSSSSTPGTTVTSTASAPPANTSLEQQAQYYADEGQYQSAEQSWQKKLASTTNASDKVAIYYQQSALAVQFKKYADAKKYADEALSLSPDSPGPYAALAQLAEAQNNIPLAKQYWQQAINHVNTNMPGYNIIQSDYKSHLDALK